MKWWLAVLGTQTLQVAGWWWSKKRAVRPLDQSRNLTLSESLPWPVAPGQPFGVALLFQVFRGTLAPTIWQRWFDDAFQWIYENGLEDPSVPRENSSILRAYIHHAFYLHPESCRASLPPALRYHLVPDPAVCWWGPTNPCTHRLFSHALEDFPAMGFGFTISHNSIPLKPFSHIYEALRADQRARLRLTYLTFGDAQLPKSSLWRGLPRKLIEIAVEHRDAWCPGEWGSDPEFGVAAPDEWQMFKAFHRVLGEQFFDLINDGGKWSRGSKRQVWVFDCWADEDCPGVGKDGLHAPFTLTSIPATLLDAWLDDRDLWFARKAKDSTVVVDRGGRVVPLYDHLSQQLFISEQTYIANLSLPNDEVREIQDQKYHFWANTEPWIEKIIRLSPPGILPPSAVRKAFSDAQK